MYHSYGLCPLLWGGGSPGSHHCHRAHSMGGPAGAKGDTSDDPSQFGCWLPWWILRFLQASGRRRFNLNRVKRQLPVYMNANCKAGWTVAESAGAQPTPSFPEKQNGPWIWEHKGKCVWIMHWHHQERCSSPTHVRAELIWLQETLWLLVFWESCYSGRENYSWIKTSKALAVQSVMIVSVLLQGWNEMPAAVHEK